MYFAGTYLREWPENKDIWFWVFLSFSSKCFSFHIILNLPEGYFFCRILELNFIFQLILSESFRFSFDFDWVFCKVIFLQDQNFQLFNFVEFRFVDFQLILVLLIEKLRILTGYSRSEWWNFSASYFFLP